MTSINDIREALLKELLDQIVNGVVVMKDDEPIRISPPAAVLSVAVKVVAELGKNETPTDQVIARGQEISDTLAKYRQRKQDELNKAN